MIHSFLVSRQKNYSKADRTIFFILVTEMKNISYIKALGSVNGKNTMKYLRVIRLMKFCVLRTKFTPSTSSSIQSTSVSEKRPLHMHNPSYPNCLQEISETVFKSTRYWYSTSASGHCRHAYWNPCSPIGTRKWKVLAESVRLQSIFTFTLFITGNLCANKSLKNHFISGGK